VEAAAPEVAGARRGPAQLVAEVELAQEPDQVAVRRQQAVVEAVPAELAVVARAREPADERLRLEQVDRDAERGEAPRQREPEDAPTDDRGRHGSRRAPRRRRTDSCGLLRRLARVPGRGLRLLFEEQDALRSERVLAMAAVAALRLRRPRGR